MTGTILSVCLSIVLAAQILLCLYLLVVLLVRRSLREQPTHWFIINALVANLLFSLVIRPGIIHDFEQGMTGEHYCRVFNILHDIEQVCIPAMLLMYTVDRMIYVQNPDLYGQRMTLPLVAGLLGLPWVVSVIIGLICTYGFHGKTMLKSMDAYNNENKTLLFCGHDYDSPFYNGLLIFEALTSLLVALTSLIVTVLVLCFYFRYRRALTFNRVYCQLEAEVTSYVKDATISVCLLNLVFLVVFVSHFLVMEFYAVAFDTHVIYFLFELFEMIIWLVVVTDIRRVNYQMCCKSKLPNSSDQQTTLTYVANAEEAK